MGAKLLTAAHERHESPIVAKLSLTSHMGKLIMGTAKTLHYAVFHVPFAGDEDWKLEVERPS